jgi:hypothetical protein
MMLMRRMLLGALHLGGLSGWAVCIQCVSRWERTCRSTCCAGRIKGIGVDALGAFLRRIIFDGNMFVIKSIFWFVMNYAQRPQADGARSVEQVTAGA